MSTALITGGSRGLGLALARELSRRGWNLVIDARGERELEEAASSLGPGEVTAIPGRRRGPRPQARARGSGGPDRSIGSPRQ